MYLNIAFCLVLVCTAKASVIDNVIETDDDTVSVESSCDSGECDQRCRRIGFTGGVCVGDRCKCDINVPLTEDAMSAFAAVSGCIPNACTNACHNLGHSNAVCVSSDKCVCYEVLHFADEESEACFRPACNRQCRRTGHSGGHCAGNKCYCDATEETFDILSSENLGKCHNKKCLEDCLKKFKPGGICIFGHCRCLS